MVMGVVEAVYVGFWVVVVQKKFVIASVGIDQILVMRSISDQFKRAGFRSDLTLYVMRQYQTRKLTVSMRNEFC